MSKLPSIALSILCAKCFQVKIEAFGLDVEETKKETRRAFLEQAGWEVLPDGGALCPVCKRKRTSERKATG